MQYNFDQIIDRTGSGDLKHNVLLERYGRNDLLPLWVADMDFATPPFITEALQQRLQHSILKDSHLHLLLRVNDLNPCSVSLDYISYLVVCLSEHS